MPQEREEWGSSSDWNSQSDWGKSEVIHFEAQEWLDSKHPKETRWAVKALNINGKKLIGSLKIEGFINLEVLRCYDNELNSLSIINCPKVSSVQCWRNLLLSLRIVGCPQIIELKCQNNLLENIDLSGLDSEKLRKISLNNNCFSQKDLSFLSSFANLEEIYLENNHFNGSLIHLRNMHKLKYLNINGNDFESGLEYLPERLSTSYRISILASYDYDIKSWRADNLGLMARAKPDIYHLLYLKINELENEIKQKDEMIISQRQEALEHYSLVSNAYLSKEAANKKVIDKQKKLILKQESEIRILEKELLIAQLDSNKNKLEKEIISKFSEETERILLEVYLENMSSKILSRQLQLGEKIKKNLNKKMNDEELQEIFARKQEIIKLTNRLEDLKLQEQSRNNHLDTLARLLTGYETCVGVCLHYGAILVASNRERPDYAESYLKILRRFANNHYSEDCEKLINLAIEQVRYKLENNTLVQNSKESRLLDYFKTSASRTEENYEYLQKNLYHLFEEVINLKRLGKDAEATKKWNYLIPWHDTGEIVNAIKSGKLDKEISEAIRERNIELVIGKDGMHAEMKIFEELLKKEREKDVKINFYIGLTKLTCFDCQIAISEFNDRSSDHLRICINGSHGKKYDGWITPEPIKGQREEMHKFYKIMNNFTEHKKETTSKIPDKLIDLKLLLEELRIQEQKLQFNIEVLPN